MSQYKFDAISASAVLTLSIPGWEKFNYRGDVVRHSWFRFQNTFFDDPEVSTMGPATKLTWMYLLAECSKKQGKQFKLTIKRAAECVGVSTGQIARSLEILVNELKWVSDDTSAYHGRNVDVALHYITVHNSTEQNRGGDSSELGADAPAASEPTPSRISRGGSGASPRVGSPESPFGVDLEKFMPTWIGLYQDEAWIRRELAKAATWLLTNPRKRKKDLGRFYLNWLNRADESRPARITTVAGAPRVTKIWDDETQSYKEFVDEC